MEEQFGFTPLATQRVMAASTETGAVGSLIYSLLSNSDIKNISDLKGKRIGVGRVLVAAAFPLQFKVIMPLFVSNRDLALMWAWSPVPLGPRSQYIFRRSTGPKVAE
jgi:hypothetical protein